MTRAPETLEPDNPLWDFALRFYGLPDVSDACLTLQADIDADVITLIAVIYAWAAQARALSGAELDALRAATAPWRAEAVLPLRRIRKGLKTERADVPHALKEQFRDRVKSAELAAERLQIAIAHAWLTATPPQSGQPDLDAALDRFVTHCGRPPSDDCNRALSVLIAAAGEMRAAPDAIT